MNVWKNKFLKRLCKNKYQIKMCSFIEDFKLELQSPKHIAREFVY